jgi:predicted RNA-binding Zn-ribbon protein involved in translation (DUF1610 family)
MKVREISEILPSVKIDEIEVDQTSVIENYFFERRYSKDYRKDSIDFMVKNRVDFHSSCNSGFDVMKRFVHVVCPVCGKNMSAGDGSGSGGTTSMQYKCEHCSVEVFITIPTEGFEVCFKLEKK